MEAATGVRAKELTRGRIQRLKEKRMEADQLRPRPSLEAGPSFAKKALKTATKALKTEELWCGAGAAAFIAWCAMKRRGEGSVEAERRAWMKENGVKYSDLKKHLDQDYAVDNPVFLTKEITLETGKTLKQLTVGICKKKPVMDAGPEVQFRYKDEDGVRQQILHKCPKDVTEPCHLLFQWGWTPEIEAKERAAAAALSS
eukprot:TRINITY_DN22251_c0_g1_i1.p1 TRINITY_DN22251_c0_g1~~TRINITY_DN22251_c0_g1_i1.p1  ORF type:complete len:220 (+),score=46.69 TRINITY_DN22251_c0_g1_i1:62-661(+)